MDSRDEKSKAAKEVKPEKVQRQRSFSLPVFTRQNAEVDLLGMKAPFEYQFLVRNKGKKIDNYQIIRMYPFIKIMNWTLSKQENPSPEKMKSMFQTKKIQTDEAGLKLHISVGGNDLEKAWSLVNKILMENNLTDYKVIDPAHLNKLRDELAKLKSEEYEETELEDNKNKKINELEEKLNTKQITIYYFKNKHIDEKVWERVISSIEEKLIDNNISSGKTPEADNSISGSKYFSYRNDKHPVTKEYMDAELAVSIAKDKQRNPSGRPSYNLIAEEDPFEKLRLFENKVGLKK